MYKVKRNNRQKIYPLLLVIFSSVISVISNLWLINEISRGFVYVYGPLPIGAYVPFKPWSSWNDILSIVSTIALSHLTTWDKVFNSSNLSWFLEEIVLPIVGGFFMYLLLKKIISILKEKNNFPLIIVGVLYTLILLHRYIDFWIKGFLVILPAIPLLSLLTFEAMKNKNWKKAILFALLTSLFLSALYDWRLQISGIVLAIVFLLGIYKFSLILGVLRERRFWIIILISFSVWCILWLIPHLYNLYLYSLSYTRSVTLPVIVGDYTFTSVFGLYSPDKILRFLYFLLICVSFSSLLLYKKHPLCKFILIASTTLILLTLIIWDSSPLKFVHRALTFLSLGKFDIGVLFRTNRVFIGIALPLTIILFGLAINGIYSLFISRKQKIVLSLIFLIFIGAIAWKVAEINNNEGKVTIIPHEYFDVANWIKEREDFFRVFWLPRTGKYAPGENPVWFKTQGWGAPETSLGVRTYYYYGRPMEYLYPFLMKILEENKTKSAAYILSDLGVKYLAIHDDYWWDALQKSVAKIKNNLNESSYFKLRYSTEHIFIYENLLTKSPVHVASTPLIIDGGLRTLTNGIELSDIDFSKFSIFFSDLQLPEEIFNSSFVAITDSPENLKFNLLTNLLISEKKEDYLIIPSHFTKGIEKGEWHPFYIDNPHHAEWEVFYSWNYPYPKGSFENSFRFDLGFVGSQTPGEELKIPINVKERGNYTILVRYLKNENGGKIEISINDKVNFISTKGNENRFEWFVVNATLTNETNVIKIRNVNGRNAINIIVLIPSKEFSFFENRVDKILKNGKTLLLQELEEGKTPELDTINDEIYVESLEYDDGIYTLKVEAETKNTTFGVTIPEQYHGGWVAFVNGNKKILSTPHMFVNNFWITLQNPGIHTIKIKFFPQDIWKIIYIVNAFMAIFILVFSLFYLIYDWRKSKAHSFSGFRK